MKQQPLVFEVGPSHNGHLKHIRVSHRALGYMTVSVLLLCLFASGLFFTYLHMCWKVSRYDALNTDFNRLRVRYQQLQGEVRQHREQMASLETLASEVSVAYGISPSPLAEAGQPMDDDSLVPSVRESIEEYNFLKSATYSEIYHRYAYAWQSHGIPSLWPLNGILRSSFGKRTDPLSGEGAFHTGIDLAAAVGTPVHVTADGVVESATWSGRYGKLVAVDHGNNVVTYYAHLSQFLVVPGQEVHRGQVIALSGGTGRVTGPHVHYEVRLAGTPVNPYKYLGKNSSQPSTHLDSSDLGL
ncbi:MAG: M23 family metallopeptidase [Acidobacteriaceae bacterium]|nr:M23 family metallopeptidase [Acidobacteriaceae bacterium]